MVFKRVREETKERPRRDQRETKERPTRDQGETNERPTRDIQRNDISGKGKKMINYFS
jgi:hypothetical protein